MVVDHLRTRMQSKVFNRVHFSDVSKERMFWRGAKHQGSGCDDVHAGRGLHLRCAEPEGALTLNDARRARGGRGGGWRVVVGAVDELPGHMW